MTSPISNPPNREYPSQLKTVTRGSADLFILSPLTAIALRTPKPIFITAGLFAMTTLANWGWERYTANRDFPNPNG